jgi:arylsulfatase A-like enzyme
VDNYRQNSLAALQSLDRAVARIVEAVEERGELDNTVFIYTSDKGVLLGEHGMFNVTWPYEPAIRVPLVVRVPWLTQGTTDDSLMTNADIAPTIAELTGVRTRIAQDGLSFAPLLHREQVPWRQEVRLSYLGLRFGRDFPPRYRAIRTDRYKLVEYDDRSRELFDLQRDPDELNNLAGTEAATEIEEPLFRRLEALMPSLPAIIEPLPTLPPSPGATPDESQD